MALGKPLTGAPPMQSMGSDQIIALVDARRRASLNYNAGLFQRLPQWYDLYRGYERGRVNQFRNNVAIPFLFAMLQSDVARKVQMSLGAWPIVSFEGYAPEDVARAEKNEVLISAQMKDDSAIVKAISFFLQANLTGTAIARYGWKNVTRKTKVRSRETIAPGFDIPVVREYMAEHFNGPTWEPVDRLDFWQQPAKVRIDEMTWVIHRYWRDLDDLEEETNGPYPYFDPGAIRALRDAPMGANTYGEWQARRLTFRDQYDVTARATERFAKPIEIWEMHGLVPKEFAPDGVRNRCIAIGNGRVVMKNREMMMDDGAIPFISYSPMPDPYSFDAPGKVEISAALQRTANRMANQKLDAIDLIIDPMWVASNQVNINRDLLFTRAGKVVLVDGAAGEENLRPLSPDMRGLQQAYPEIAQLWEFMQLGSGINDIIMGLQGGQRETARGFLGRQENVLTRLSMEARAADEQFLEPLANAFRKLNRKLLPMPYEQKILGSMAMVNPITGLPYPQNVTIDYDDLAPDYRARAVGASQMMGRSVKQQNWMTLLQVMSTNPVFQQMTNWANVLRQTFELFDFRNIDELLVQMVPQVNQAALQAGAGGEAGVAGAQPAQTLGQPSPEILGQIMGAQGQAAPLPMG